MKINNTEISTEKISRFFKNHTKKQKSDKNCIKCRLVDINNNMEYKFNSLTEMSRWLGYARWPHSTEYGIVHKKGESFRKYKLYKEN